MLLGCFYSIDVAIFELAALGPVQERVLPENVPKKKRIAPKVRARSTGTAEELACGSLEQWIDYFDSTN